MTPQELKAMKLALEALELLTGAWQTFGALDYGDNAITAIEEALAEHAMQKVQRLGQEIEQEPVAWLSTDSIGERHLCFDKPLDNDPVQPLYTAPPQRTWVNLPDEEIKILWIQYRAALPRYLCFAKALLSRAKEKNT